MNTKKLIVVIAIVLPIIVAALYLLPKPEGLGSWVHMLPFYNAWVNGATFLSVLLAIISVKNGNVKMHRVLMAISLALSVVFLILYVLYHSMAAPTHFGGVGMEKWVYYFVLISHIVLAAIIAPLVLVSVSRALNGNIEGHRKIAKITYPIWLYVSITGVIVYVMISPYYGV